MIGALLWLAAAAAHPPEIERHLAMLVGDWTKAGKEATYRDHCVWYDRHAFVVCSLTDGASGLKLEAVVGYAKADQRFTYQSFGNDGASRVQSGYPRGESGLVFTDERELDGKMTRLTTAIDRRPDGRLHMTLERSVAGGPWEKVGEVDYIPRK